jgi:hypothetical protein
MQSVVIIAPKDVSLGHEARRSNGKLVLAYKHFVRNLFSRSAASSSLWVRATISMRGD